MLPSGTIFVMAEDGHIHIFIFRIHAHDLHATREGVALYGIQLPVVSDQWWTDTKPSGVMPS